jgi:hypothetical protein
MNAFLLKTIKYFSIPFLIVFIHWISVYIYSIYCIPTDMYGILTSSNKSTYETVSYSIKTYLDNLHNAIQFLKDYGIDEEKLVICNNHSCLLE